MADLLFFSQTSKSVDNFDVTKAAKSKPTKQKVSCAVILTLVRTNKFFTVVIGLTSLDVVLSKINPKMSKYLTIDDAL